jgi:hypothetical protein
MHTTTSSHHQERLETEFMFFRLEGEIDEDIIENIENAKNYLNDFKYEEIQEIIKDNTGKKTRYGTPEGCITGNS